MRWPLYIGMVAACFIHEVMAQEQEVDAPLPPQMAARSMQVPAGFNVSLFAGEPDVMQPIGFCIDDRGRLWVAEAYSYPNHGEGVLDRIVIFEDQDGDGQHDKRTVFYEGLNYVTGIEVGFGGVWIMSPPYFYFIPDRDADDRPDSPPQVLLDGFGNHANAHNLANGFAWGPDGWLYGTHGRTNWSMIGKPGALESERVRFDGGVYRYHPIRHVWEAYADGTTNPWGIDWNDWGHAFVCNCVNPHLFQVIQGAHYEPWRGRESSQFAYQRIDTIADHLHYVGLSNVRRGLGSAEEDAAGGGHAHCGTMIYLGDNFPETYRNALFTNNIHGRRINMDTLKRNGSGYIGSHGPDLMRAEDPWFMGVTLAYGPAGEVYVSDWSDTGECHSTRNTRRQTGRIYRITYGKTLTKPVDLTHSTSLQLADLQLHKNDWYVRHARRQLQERAAAGQEMTQATERLKEIYIQQSDVTRKLRALWALYVMQALDERFLHGALTHQSEDIRAWAITLLFENPQPSLATLSHSIALATSDTSSLVRLSLASALQRIPLAERWELALSLCRRAEDEADPNLPLMLWYAVEPLIEQDMTRYIGLAESVLLARVQTNIARRVASSTRSQEGLELLSQTLSKPLDDRLSQNLLTGILQGIEGRRNLELPASWHTAYQRLSRCENLTIQDHAVRLAVAFNDQAAMGSLQQLALQSRADAAARRLAIDALVTQRFAGFELHLLKLLGDDSVRPSVLRGLAVYNQPQTPTAILEHFPTMSDRDKQDALLTLASREAWTLHLLDAIEAERLRASELTAFVARQIRSLGNPDISTRLAQLWGEVRETPIERAKKIAAVKSWLTDDVLAQADLQRGKQVFSKQCANCHRFFGEGGTIGPDITGAQRNNLDYMLENIIDPNASVAKDYRMEIIQVSEGRVLTGLVQIDGANTIAVQTVNERIILPKEDIVDRKLSDVSIMPDGLLDPLTDNEIRDLLGYLQSAEHLHTN